MNKNIFSLLCFLFCLPFMTIGLAQESAIDSLENELLNHQTRDTIRVNLLTALIYRVQDVDIKRAEDLLEEAEDLAEVLGFKKGQADVIYNKACVALIKSKYAESMAYFNNAFLQYESLNLQSKASYCLNGIGTCYYHQGDFSKAIEYYTKSLVIHEALNDLKAVSGRLINIANIYADQGEFEKAIAKYTEAKIIKEKIKDHKGTARAYANIGTIYMEQGDFPQALDFFNKALLIYEREGLMDYSYNLLMHFGLIYGNQNNPSKALSYYNRALKILEKRNDKNRMAICLNRIGNVRIAQSENEKALTLFQEALRIHKSINNKRGIGEGLSNVANVQLLLDRGDKVLDNYHQALMIFKEIDSKLGICKSSLGIARYYLKQKEYSEVLRYALNVQEIATQLKSLRPQKDAAELLSKAYSELGKYKKALESHHQFKLLNDSLFNKENIEKITQLEYDYKYQQQLDASSIRELELTQVVNATAQDLEQSQRNLLLGVIAFLLMSLALGSIIFFLKLRNTQSKAQNIIIEQKLLRSQMTPHFVFNSLSVLQGMILNKENQKSISYLSKFSKLLRVVLENSREKVVPLDQELESIKNYVELQNLEVNQAYEYTIQVDNQLDTTEFKIPPMLIQPFVENAIEHAFEKQKEDRKVDIQLNYSNKELICTIADNGIGIDSQKENENENENENEKNSLATAITSERLEMLSKDFKMKGSVTIEDRNKYNEQGTLVTLIIPHQKLVK